jgi:hypothetical protein
MQIDIRHLIITISLFILTSCGHEDENKNSQSIVDTDTISVKQNLSQANSPEVIGFPCAIILSPSDKTIDSLKKINGEDFYTYADDIMYYTNIATTYLDSLKIKTISKTSEGSITFHITSGKDTVFNLSDMNWAILLFNGKDGPKQSDITDFKTEFDNYMRTK